MINSELGNFPIPMIKLGHRLASFSEGAAECYGNQYEVWEPAEVPVECSSAD